MAGRRTPRLSLDRLRGFRDGAVAPRENLPRRTNPFPRRAPAIIE
jgi:hypothetical protein